MSKGRDKGLKKEVRGLWTDVVASPYFSFGIDCDAPNSFAEGLHEILNKVVPFLFNEYCVPGFPILLG